MPALGLPNTPNFMEALATEVSAREAAPPYKTDFDWSRECDRIAAGTDSPRHRPADVKGKAEFLAYCTAQRDLATRDGKHDSATYIQQCIDDLKAAK